MSKYELFMRLNTGGSKLSDQEVRSCLLISVNSDMFETVKRMSEYIPFKESVGVPQRAFEEQFDIELVLRFIILRNLPEVGIKNTKDLDSFLTNQMIKIARDPGFDWNQEIRAFESTFDLIRNSSSGGAFKKYDAQRDKFSGVFLVSVYEVIALGLGYQYGKDKLDSIDIVDIAKNLWSNEEFTRWSGSGVNASTRLPRLIPLGRKLLSP